MGVAFAITLIGLALWNAFYCIGKIVADRRARRSAAMLSGLLALTGAVAPLIVLLIVSLYGS